MASKKLFAFVLMPFDGRFDDIYRIAIKETARDLDIIAERVDEQIYSESILERIFRQIDAADFVIADMTGQNPNVFYEVGYAHAKSKICTLITQDAADIPFDLKHHRHIVYGSSLQSLRDALTREFEWLRAEIEKRQRSIFDVVFRPTLSTLNTTDWSVRGELDLMIDINNRTEQRTPEIDALYLLTRNDWTFSQGDSKCPYTAVDGKPDIRRHLVKSPIGRIGPGAFAQVTVKGDKPFWTKWGGEERREMYSVRGDIRLEIATSEGTFPFVENLDITFDDIPF